MDSILSRILHIQKPICSFHPFLLSSIVLCNFDSPYSLHWQEEKKHPLSHFPFNITVIAINIIWWWSFSNHEEKRREKKIIFSSSLCHFVCFMFCNVILYGWRALCCSIHQKQQTKSERKQKIKWRIHKLHLASAKFFIFIAKEKCKWRFAAGLQNVIFQFT